MGIAINNFASSTEDRASGAQIIDGSLRFDKNRQTHLQRSFTSSGNARTWTWSCWIKRSGLSTQQHIFSPALGNNSQESQFYFQSSGLIDTIRFYDGGGLVADVTTTRVMRDVGGWFHFVFIYDSTESVSSDRIRFYINSDRTNTTNEYGGFPAQNAETGWNKAVQGNPNNHFIGRYGYQNISNDHHFDGYMSQCYFIDGQALEPSYFGFTDPLTNTWRPKKYTGTYGTNGFYLPMDGNSLIGEDKSGNGNNWTPVNFGGSNTIEKATGAFPILNTDDGGNVARVGVRTDAYASNLVLAIPMVGISSDVSNQINSGSTTKTVTNNGTASGVTTSGNFYGGSFYFGGSGNYLSFNSSSDLAFGTSPYTVEMWVNPFALPGGGILFSNSSNNGFVTNMDTGGIAINQYGIGDKVATTEGIPLNQWSHLAFVREGTGSNQAKIYINGVVRATGTDATDWTVTTNPGFGANIAHGGQPINAYAQDLRVYKGVAKYTSNFIPASTDPDILPDTPSGVAGGSALTKITDGAVYFDGTSDYLSLAANTDFNFGTGSFTIEGFFYKNATGNRTLVASGQYYNVGNNGNWVLRITNDNTIGFASYDGQSSEEYTEFGAVNVRNAWYHFAFVREGTGSNESKFYLNGKHVGSMTVSKSLTDGGTNGIFIGDDVNGPNGPMNGFISNLRILKGTALYTSNFTPPTRALTNVTNTVLLCCQSTTTFNNGAQPILNTNSTGSTVTSGTRNDPYASSIVLALAMNGSNGGTTFTDIHPTIKGSGSAKTVTVNGDAQTSTAESKYYGSSGLFDGTGDYLTLSGSTDFEFTGEFTIEYYLYLTSNSGENPVISWGNGSYKTIFIPSGQWRLEYPSTGVTLGGQVVLNTWVHYALTRDGSNNLRWFINGQLQSTNSISSTIGSTDTLYIGRKDNSGAHVTGHIQDLRIYKGAAKYTKSFTVTEPTLDVPAAVAPGSITANGDAAATNFNPFTTDINTVRGQESGYATLNPLDNNGGTLSNGNLKSTSASTSNVNATISVSSGKWYWEVLISDSASGGVIGVGAGGAMKGTSLGDLSKIYGWSPNGSKYQNTTQLSYSVTYGVGDLIGIKFDADSGELEFYKNGISRGVAFTVDSGYDYFPQFHLNGMNVVCNFGQKPFKFPPPDGFQPLNASNARPSTVIARPDQYFKTVLYNSNGTSLTISDLNLSPDLVWIKKRNGSQDHEIQDTVRGATNSLSTSNITAAETTDSQSITSFTSNGFTIGSSNSVNENSRLYVAWCWEAGGNSNTFNVDGVGYATASDAGITDGTIALTGASVNTVAGFSILTFTGQSNAGSIAHGLSKKPSFIIGKNRDRTTDWKVYLPNTGQYMDLSTNAAQSSVSNGYTGATSSLINLQGSGYGLNYATDNQCVIYCWTEIEGFSKFGQWNNNNSANGTFIELGFRPAMILLKNTDNVEDWYIIDSARHPYNKAAPSASAADAVPSLNPNQAHSESTSQSGHSNTTVDILSNGFKIRTTNTGAGEISFGTRNYIYAAWAEAPSNNLFGAQANAR